MNGYSSEVMSKGCCKNRGEERLVEVICLPGISGVAHRSQSWRAREGNLLDKFRIEEEPREGEGFKGEENSNHPLPHQIRLSKYDFICHPSSDSYDKVS